MASATVQPIDPYNDPRIQHRTANLNGHTYHYVYGQPKDGEPRATVFLIHGWPDLWYGWRYQIPFLIEEVGLRVVAMDMMGYGGTDAPQVTPGSKDIHLYGFKRAADDIAELAKQLGVGKIILGGHDWGGAVVWRAAQWHPELVTHVFSVCTPYFPIADEYVSHEDVVKKYIPQFGYQLQLASPTVESRFKSKEDLRLFFSTLFGGRGPNDETAFDPFNGFLLDNVTKIGKPKLLDDAELDYYVDQFAAKGLHGPLNWYRTREANFKDDRELKSRPNSQTIDVPTLFVQATLDFILTPALSQGMEKYLTNLTRREVESSHWALTQKPDEVNSILKEWLEEVALGDKSKL